MKTKIIFVFLVLGFLVSPPTKAVDRRQAGEILKNHFIDLMEIKDSCLDVPDVLVIPFSQKFLEKNKNAWLVPIKTKSGFKYFLVQASFENEFCALKNIDTLDFVTAIKVIATIKKIRPNFPGRPESDLPFKYFFRTNQVYSTDKQEYKKTISYDGKNFIVVAWPDGIELGMMGQDYISYVAPNKQGVETKLKSTPLPDNHPKVKEQQGVLVLTLFSCRE